MRRILGGLLFLQVLAMASIAVLAQVIFEGIGPDDDVFPQSEYEARARLAGVVLGAMILLSSVSLVYVAEWIRNRRNITPWPLVAAHLGAALALAVFQRPIAAALLLLAGVTWGGVDTYVRARSPHRATSTDSMVDVR
jgi:hypothetical protein